MAKAVEIERIDLLVHPFFSLGNPGTYKKKDGKFLFELWKEHIDEIAKDPARILFISPAYEGALIKKLLNYANKKLGGRFATFISNTLVFVDGKGKKIEGFRTFAKAKEFKINSEKVKTRALGEYTNKCVTDWLIVLNKEIGLKNPVPYRNTQSTLLPRKSVSSKKKGYPKPWELARLLKEPGGKKKLREMMLKHGNARRKKANQESQGKGFKEFKPRTHLMKKKPATKKKRRI